MKHEKMGRQEAPLVYFLLLYDVVDDYVNRRAPFRAEHLARAKDAQDRGILRLGGALADPADGAMLVFRTADRSVVERFAEEDPYVRNGVVTRWRVREWSVVIGADAG